MTRLHDLHAHTHTCVMALWQVLYIRGTKTARVFDISIIIVHVYFRP